MTVIADFTVVFVGLMEINCNPPRIVTLLSFFLQIHNESSCHGILFFKGMLCAQEDLFYKLLSLLSAHGSF